jgi:hypothetical protein
VRPESELLASVCRYWPDETMAALPTTININHLLIVVGQLLSLDGFSFKLGTWLVIIKETLVSAPFLFYPQVEIFILVLARTLITIIQLFFCRKFLLKLV